MVPFLGAAIYYQNRACNYTTETQYCNTSQYALAFPDGFRMIAGDASRRTMNYSDVTNLAVKMMCYNPNGVSGDYQGLPPVRCETLRAEVYFPSCWDGIHVDSSNHKTHVAYPTNFDGGVCPSSHPVAIFSIFFEFFFDTSSYVETNRFVFAQGDTTGYGFHGDFIMGWTDRVALQASFETCVNTSYCPIDTAGSVNGNNVQSPQNLINPAIYEEEIGLNGPIAQLPGNNPVNWDGSTEVLVKIYSKQNGLYWVSPGKTGPITASATEAAASTWKLVGKDMYTTFINEADQLFIQATNGGASTLVAISGSPSTWESFMLVKQSDDTYILLAQANNELVALQADGTLIPNGNQDVTLSTSFNLVYLNSSSTTVKSVDGTTSNSAFVAPFYIVLAIAMLFVAF